MLDVNLSDIEIEANKRNVPIYIILDEIVHQEIMLDELKKELE